MPDADYFSAADDEAALAVIDDGPQRAGLDVIFLKDIDPVDAIAQLEAIMTGCSYAEAGRRPRTGLLLSSPGVESPFVVTVSDSLFDALVRAAHDDVVSAAEAWSAGGGVRGLDVATATVIVDALTGLAQRARANGLQLYCWWTM